MKEPRLEGRDSSYAAHVSSGMLDQPTGLWLLDRLRSS
jgi:hypothetical protein